MKIKLLFTFALVFTVIGKSAFGQACTPDPQYPSTSHGIHPDSATNFVQGYANQAYTQLVTIVVPQDTTPPFPPVPIPWDSTVLVSITGLPNGFTYACWNNSPAPNRCSWPGGTIGCAIITGNPTIADTGTHNLQVATQNYLGGSTTPINYTITYYKIKINGPSGIQNLDASQFMVGDPVPNPFGERTEVDYNLPKVCQVSIKVYNLVGTEVYAYSGRGQKGLNKFFFDRNGLAPGMYVYSISTGEQVITKRMVISK